MILIHIHLVPIDSALDSVVWQEWWYLPPNRSRSPPFWFASSQVLIGQRSCLLLLWVASKSAAVPREFQLFVYGYANYT
jgi:hypothetical protein